MNWQAVYWSQLQHITKLINLIGALNLYKIYKTSKAKENANKRKYVCCAPAVHYTQVYAFICVH